MLGADQVTLAAQEVRLAGVAVDSDGRVVTYQWSQLSGSAVALVNADQASASFVSPSVTVSQQLVFELLVIDDQGGADTDRVTITVNPMVVSALPDFGPDVDQCPVTQADRSASVIHVCDCQHGDFVNCTPGDDANAGTAAAPRRTLSAAASAFSSGSDVALCRGGAWATSVGLSLDASSCTSASPCTLQDYGDPALAKPLISLNLSGASNGLELAPGSDLVRWEGVRLQNLHLTKFTRDGQGFGVFVFRNVNDVEMRCMEIEGFGIGAYVNSNGKNTSRVTLSDSSLHDNGVMGWLGGTNQTLIERNRFHNNGGFNASALQHNVYLSEMRNDGIVRGNWLSESAVDGNGQCVGASLIAHNDNSVNLLIENNLIEESNPSPGCWGLTVDSAGSTTESHRNAVIRGNLVRNVGNVSIGIASCVDCLIENNIVVQTAIGGAIGIASPNRPSAPPDADVTGTIVRNNTVYFSGTASGNAYYIGERGSGYVVANNIGFYANPQAGDACYSYDLAASAYALVNSNLCYGAAFDIGTRGLDGMAFTSDPLFLNAPLDLRLDDASPARNAGTNVSAASVDMLGNPRDGTPDLGAFEVQ